MTNYNIENHKIERCPNCLSSQIYKRNKRYLPTRRELARLSKTRYKKDEVIKMDMTYYRCVTCKSEFNEPLFTKTYQKNQLIRKRKKLHKI